MKSIKTRIVTATAVMLFAFVSVAPVSTVYSLDQKKNLCGGSNFNLSPGDQCVDNLDKNNGEGKLNNLIKNIVNILSVIVGIVAVVMIIIGGFKYITSGGDSGNISSAKNTIIYAIVGLIIVALAQVIVRFVLSKAT